MIDELFIYWFCCCLVWFGYLLLLFAEFGCYLI